LTVTIFGINVAEKVGNENVVYFPPHLTSASALPEETGSPEIVSFHLNAACFFTKLNHPSLSCQNDRLGAPDRT